MRTLLRNLRIVEGRNETRRASILIEGGKIVDVLSPSEEVGAECSEDLGDCLLLPAAIDGHVHFDDPGYTHREDFFSGTRAAAAGGVGLVVDMPCTSIPEVTTRAGLEEKLSVIETKAVIDYMLWGGISGQCLEKSNWREEAAALVEAGVAAFKFYLISGMESFKALEYSQLNELFQWARSAGIPIGVHAEDPDVIAKACRELGESDSPQAYADSRPAACEVEAVRRLIDHCRSFMTRLHVVHLASGEALGLLARARVEGVPISAETCPHYLLLNVDDLRERGSLLKTAPVVKAAEDSRRLWEGLASGEILYVASDHAAAQYPEEKQTSSIWSDYGGVPGVELLLPTLYSEGYRRGRLSLARLVEITSTAAASFFGVSGRKGKIASGFDADFAVIDEEAHWIVSAADLHNKNRYTPLEGRRLEGRIVQTWLRGRCVYRRLPDGREEFGAPGGGEWIRREEKL